MTKPLPSVRYVALGPVVAGVTAWTFGGQLSLTLCAKASFALQPNQDMTLLSPLPLRREELKRLPSLSVLAPADVLPQLPRPEVTLVGHAQNPANTNRSRVRLALTRDGDTLIDKRLDVVGDRAAGKEPAPFTEVRLSYENALGGIGYADNPLGRGKGAVDDALPNVIDPADPEGTVAAFAPIPSAFATRRRRLAKLAARTLAADVVAIPDTFDWSYFQAAPEDQRIDTITGEEWIWLEGMLPQHLHFRSRLPGVHVAARTYGSGGGTIPDFIPLRAESLHIDTDEGVASLVWRGSFPVLDEVPSLLAAVGLSVGREPIAWPQTLEELLAFSSREATAAGGGSPGVTHETLSITNRIEKRYTTTHDVEPSGHVTLPFDVAERTRASDAPVLPIPGAPWSPDKGREVKTPTRTSRTLLTEESRQAAAALRAEIDQRVKAAEAKKAEEAEEAAARARADAERRREQEAAKFEREQREAAEEASRRAAADAEDKKRAAARLLDDLYGGFKR